MIIAMLAICASAMVFTSCGDDDDDDNPSSNNQSGKTTWAKIVNEHSWLSIFPEYPGYIDNDMYLLNQGAMESETITVTGRNQSELDSYFSNISKLKGFEKSWGESEYFYEYEDDKNNVTYIVQGMYMEAMGVKTSQITFSIIKD